MFVCAIAPVKVYAIAANLSFPATSIKCIYATFGKNFQCMHVK